MYKRDPNAQVEVGWVETAKGHSGSNKNHPCPKVIIIFFSYPERNQTAKVHMALKISVIPFSGYVQSVCKTGSIQVKDLKRLRQYLTQQTTIMAEKVLA